MRLEGLGREQRPPAIHGVLDSIGKGDGDLGVRLPDLIGKIINRETLWPWANCRYLLSRR